MTMKSETGKHLDKKTLHSVFWRAFLLPSCYSMDRMQAPGFAYSMIPVLKKLYGDDKEKLTEGLLRHSEVYNNTYACSPFVLLQVLWKKKLRTIRILILLQSIVLRLL